MLNSTPLPSLPPSILLSIPFLLASINLTASTLLTRELNSITNNLITFNSHKLKSHPVDYSESTFYYSPYMNLQENDTKPINVVRDKRTADSTFRGKPKTVQEVWARNFNLTSQEYSQSSSLVALMSQVIVRYLGACIPVILYDGYVENSEGFILQRLFQEFPSSFIHGKINHNGTLDNFQLLEPPDAKCRSYILFLADALLTRAVIGPQIENKVIIVPRSSQWKLQEFLSAPSSRDIINLLVIGESYSNDKTKERPYVLYTHRLYTDGLGSNKPLVLTSWMKGKLSRPHVNLFPTKLTKGFAGHRFAVAAADFPPFVFKKLSTDGVGNVQIRWDGYEYRILQVLGKMMNFTFDIGEPKNLVNLGPGDAVADAVVKGQYDIGIAGMYVTAERNLGMEMSVSHSADCAAFITMASKALPRYRAILGPFQWPVWLCLTLTYLLAIIPLAYSDSLTLRYLIEKPGQIENMFWYVFGTFTNSLTFTGELSWSSSKKSSTRLLIGFYWVFTIIITACYTGSIIAFVTLPVYPETVDSIGQLNYALYRVGTLDRGGWERWFLNSYDKETARLFKKLEYVKDINEGIGNVTSAYFLFPYAFIGSRAQLEYMVQTNYTDDKLGRRSALHISDQCFALFGVALALKEESVYRSRFNDGLLMLQQSGIISKIMNDVRWDMIRSSTGSLLTVSSGKALKMGGTEEKGLTLADTEGMFLLLGIGFVIAGGALVSEWVGGCTNKCIKLVKRKRELKKEEHRIEEEERIEQEKRDAEIGDLARLALQSASSVIGLNFLVGSQELLNENKNLSSNPSSRSTSLSVGELSPAMLTEMYDGPSRKYENIVMIDGKMMNESDALQYANDFREDTEVKEVDKNFKFLKENEESQGSISSESGDEVQYSKLPEENEGNIKEEDENEEEDRSKVENAAGSDEHKDSKRSHEGESKFKRSESHDDHHKSGPKHEETPSQTGPSHTNSHNREDNSLPSYKDYRETPHHTGPTHDHKETHDRKGSLDKSGSTNDHSKPGFDHQLQVKTELMKLHQTSSFSPARSDQVDSPKHKHRQPRPQKRHSRTPSIDGAPGTSLNSTPTQAKNKQVVTAEINIQAATPTDIEHLEKFFGEKIEEPKVKRRGKKS